MKLFLKSDNFFMIFNLNLFINMTIKAMTNITLPMAIIKRYICISLSGEAAWSLLTMFNCFPKIKSFSLKSGN